MEQNNSNIPIVKIGDTIYERYGSYDLKSLRKRTVERITKTQIILDQRTKLRNNPLRMYGDTEAYCLSAISRTAWTMSDYYLETEELIVQYKHEQLLLKTKKRFESLDLKKLTEEQLSLLLFTMAQITIVKKSEVQNNEEETEHK